MEGCENNFLAAGQGVKKGFFKSVLLFCLFMLEKVGERKRGENMKNMENENFNKKAQKNSVFGVVVNKEDVFAEMAFFEK